MFTWAKCRFVPGPRLIALLLALGTGSLAVALAGVFWPQSAVVVRGTPLMQGLLLALGGVSLFDWLVSWRMASLSIERQMPASIAVNKWVQVSLHIRHDFKRRLQLHCYDCPPINTVTPNMDSGRPLKVLLQPGVSSSVRYALKAVARGTLEFQGCVLRIPSRWNLWLFDVSQPLPGSVKVYPDFSAITAYTLLATDNHVSQIGIKRKQRRGAGMEFHQLREYRQGDSLRQVDWKATSRKRKLISKDYQDERDQQVVLLVDSGRRMRAKDDELSHFDHSLNALLLVSYIALRQGDSVGVMSFGEDNRWVPPQKGIGKVPTILNNVYDLQAGNTAPDYLAAAQRLTTLQNKRSLVILVTNFRDEDVGELTAALHLLRKRHVVLLVNMREGALDEVLLKPVETFQQALEYAGVNHYLASRDKIQQQLQSQGILALDCKPRDLAVRVANSYLEIKRAGLL